jgi:hypothetical protein
MTPTPIASCGCPRLRRACAALTTDANDDQLVVRRALALLGGPFFGDEGAVELALQPATFGEVLQATSDDLISNYVLAIDDDSVAGRGRCSAPWLRRCGP